jgi:murein DD-endopeptidase MepM/ murein hydrolase activator NlpD
MSQKGENRRKKLIKKLKNRYRLLIMNETTFDERFSMLLSPLNVIAGFAMISLAIAVIVVSAIVFTPLKEYIPGYSDTQTRLRALNAAVQADSLEQAQLIYKSYFDNLRRILRDEVGQDSLETQVENTQVYDELDFSVSDEENALRQEIESRERYALSASGGDEDIAGLPGVLFFAPIRGQITSSFDSSIEHFGVDVTAPEGEAIKAVYDGVVTLASFTSDGGNVIQIQHANNLLSVYKHNSVLLKKVGDQVTAGESIAIIGNTGEFSDGPHLHFELWHKGAPLNPQEFISFTN